MGHPICHTSPPQNSTFKVQSSTFSAASFTNPNHLPPHFPLQSSKFDVRCSKFIPLPTPSPPTTSQSPSRPHDFQTCDFQTFKLFPPTFPPDFSQIFLALASIPVFSPIEIYESAEVLYPVTLPQQFLIGLTDLDKETKYLDPKNQSPESKTSNPQSCHETNLTHSPPRRRCLRPRRSSSHHHRLHQSGGVHDADAERQLIQSCRL